MMSALRLLDRLPDGDVAAQVLRVNCLITLALSDFQLGGLAPAKARLSAAEAALSGLPFDDARALRTRVSFQRGAILFRAGDFRRADRDVSLALADRSAFTKDELCAVLMTSGLVRAELGRAADAARQFRGAQSLARAIGNETMLASAMHNEAYAAYVAGDLVRAMALFRAQSPAGAGRAPVINHLDAGLLLLECGLVSEAVEELSTGLSVQRTHRYALAEVELELAHSYRLIGDPVGARIHVRRALARYRRLGVEAGTDRATVFLAQLDLDEGRSTTASESQLVAVADRAVLGQDAALESRALTVAAEVALAHGNPRRARELLGVARLPRPRSVQADLHRALVDASSRAAEGDRAAARRVAARGARRIAEATRGIASLDVRTAAAIHGVRLATLDLDLALASGPLAVLAALDRWRSATDHLPSLRPPQDPHLADLSEQLRRLQVTLRRGAEAGNPVAADPRNRDLQALIRQRDWTLRHTEDAPQGRPLTVPAARQRLAELDRDLLWLTPHRDRLMGVAVVDGRAMVRDLMAMADAEELARRIRADLRMAAMHHLGGLH
ncbi:MAG: hypothetical protein ABI131_00350, partial [Nostocoides sp.]